MGTKKVVIVGDAILDRHVFCRRIPGRMENNAPIIQREHTLDRPGGAANVALHLSCLVKNVSLVSLFGDDSGKQILKTLLSRHEPSIHLTGPVAAGVPTVTKHRLVELPSNQLVRVDIEAPEAVPSAAQTAVVAEMKKELDAGAVLVISDYEKGCLSDEACRSIIDCANHRGCTVLVDGKCKHPEKYAGAFFIKPNRAELSAMTGLPADTVEDAAFAAQKLRRITKSAWVLVTLDKDGMLLVGQNDTRCIPASAIAAGSAVGAGDIVMAHVAAGLAQGNPIEAACMQASISVAATLMQAKDMPVPQGPPSARADKVVTMAQLEHCLSQLREDRRIVFTNGCFDILHAGHIFSLEEASKWGDILVVGVNDDASVRRNKGQGRPINPLRDRMCVLSALNCVNFVVSFSEDTPIDLIKRIRPDVLVKGGDYAGKAVIGSEFVASYGGKVILTGYDDGHSTTRIIAQIGGTEP